MSDDAKLRKLRRDYEQGDYPSGAQLIVEMLQLGEVNKLEQADLDSWAAAWRYNEEDDDGIPAIQPGERYDYGRKATAEWRLLCGWMTEGSYAETTCVWIGQRVDGKWFYAEGGCDTTGWDCQSHLSVLTMSDVTDLMKHLTTDDVRRILK